ncbi:MAG TPA: regulatory iron-sulfur-containing complex subunit RicT [Candidatus Gracilibacteria bacterium]
MITIQVEDYFRGKRFYIEVADGVKPELGDFLLLKKEKDQMVAQTTRVIQGSSYQSLEKGWDLKQKLTPEDVTSLEEAQKGEGDRLIKARALAVKHKVALHFFASKVNFDEKQITFFFTSDEPVDFRELLKDMVKEFTGRIQLERVKSRDRAAMLDGGEICGARSYAFLRINQDKIPMDVVRDQGIVIKGNNKIFDASGKIKPSMMYEVEAYKKNRRYLPHIQQIVKIKESGLTAKVTGLDILNHRVKVVFEEMGGIDFYHVNDLEFNNQRPIPEELGRPVADVDIEARVKELEETEQI